MATKGRAGERLIPRTASSPRGLGRHLLSPSKRPSSSRELTQGGRSSRRPGHLGGVCAWCSNGVPMGRQHGPPVPRWRQLLHAGCWWLLSLSGMTLWGLRWLWRLAWYLLICYKSCWDGAFQVTEELGMALQLRLESGSEGSEEEDGGSISVLASGRAGGSPAWQCGCRGAVAGAELGARAGAEWQQRGDASEAVLGRLEALEADVRFLCTELGAEKLLWSSRFLELLQEQQGLRQRLQERPWRWDSGDSPELPGGADEPSASGSEGQSPAGHHWMEPP